MELEKLFQEKSNIFEARSDQQKLLDQIGIEWNQKISQLEIELTRKQSQVLFIHLFIYFLFSITYILQILAPRNRK